MDPFVLLAGFAVACVLFLVVVVAVLLAFGFRPQRGRRSRSHFGHNGGVGDGSGGTTP
ncbi:MAG: hypothetical protein PIR53_09915 [Nocardioides alkalitolerans]